MLYCAWLFLPQYRNIFCCKKKQNIASPIYPLTIDHSNATALLVDPLLSEVCVGFKFLPGLPGSSIWHQPVFRLFFPPEKILSSQSRWCPSVLFCMRVLGLMVALLGPCLVLSSTPDHCNSNFSLRGIGKLGLLTTLCVYIHQRLTLAWWMSSLVLGR